MSELHPTDIIKKNRKRQESKGMLFGIAPLHNPLARQIKPSKTMQDFFKQFPFAPYSGDTHMNGHAKLDLLFDLRDLSSTHSACINAKKRFIFRSKIHFYPSSEDVFQVEPDLDFEPDPITGPEAEEIATNLGEVVLGDNTPNWKDAILYGYETWSITGDVWIEMVLGRVGSETATGMYLQDPRDVLHKIYEDGDPYPMVGIHDDWERARSYPQEIRMIPLYPFFQTFPDGTLRTMIHQKHGYGDYYGRPETIGCLVSQFREHQDAIYLAKIAARNFTGQIMYEMEGEGALDDLDKQAQKAGFANFADQLAQMATNEAQRPMTALFHTRPVGASASTMHQIKPNTSENFYSTTGSMARANIILAHQMSERLLGLDSSSGWQSNVFWDEAATKEKIAFRFIHEEVMEPYNLAYQIMAEWMGWNPDINLGFRLNLADEHSTNDSGSNQEQPVEAQPGQEPDTGPLDRRGDAVGE